jgi:hypothetical protein
MDARQALEQEWHRKKHLKGMTIKNINGKPFLYSGATYMRPATKEDPDIITNSKVYLKTLQWTIKNLDQVLKAIRLLNDIAKSR